MAASEKHRRLVRRRKRSKKVAKLKARIAESSDRKERERLVEKLQRIAPKVVIPD